MLSSLKGASCHAIDIATCDSKIAKLAIRKTRQFDSCAADGGAALQCISELSDHVLSPDVHKEIMVTVKADNKEICCNAAMRKLQLGLSMGFVAARFA